MNIAEIEKSCVKYDLAQPVFARMPSLFKSARKCELINYRDITRHSPSSLCFRVNKHSSYGVIDYRLPMFILEKLDSEYVDMPSFVRIDPYQVLLKPTLDSLNEEVVNFPDPVWWKDLRIYNNKDKGSSYQLLGNPEDKNNLWDYLAKGIRRLEFHAGRRDSNNPYLSMMMEELEIHQNETEEDKNYLVGRMIHLDTDAKVGDDFKKAKMLHIDLAYNYYFGNVIDTRMGQDLSVEGKVVEASKRTHILRIENISLCELFPIAFAFFKSQTMVNEWCHYQFLNAEFDAEHRIQQ